MATENVSRSGAGSDTANDMMSKKDLGVVSSTELDDTPSREPLQPARVAGKLNVLAQGVALFSDVYNIQIIGYVNTVLGFAAAVGKAGAAVGTTAMIEVLAGFDDRLEGQQAIFLIGSGISVVGTLCVWFLIPNAPRRLEDEDVRFKRYLEAKGYDNSSMGLRA